MKQTHFSSVNFQNNQKNAKSQQNSLYKYIKQIGNRSYSSKKLSSNQIQFPFKPSISQLPVQLYPSTRDKIQISKQSLTERLIQNKLKKDEMLKIQKIQQEEVKFKKDCTFKPQLSHNSVKIVKQKFKTQGQMDAYNRLYSHALQKKIFQNVNNSELVPQFSFQPQINPTSKAILNQQKRNLDPIYKRLDQILKQKRQKRKQIEQNDVIKQKQQQFVGNNTKTKEIIQSKSELKKYVLDRLFNFNQKKKSNIEKALGLQKQKMQQLCPFKPTIFPNNFSFNEQTFLERQIMFEQKTKQNVQNIINQEKLNFRPEINRISQILIRQKRQYQTIQDKCNRLHYQTLQKEEKLQELTEDLYKQCTFQPKINQISKAINCVPKTHNCKCQKKQEAFQFKPKICEKSRQILNSGQVSNKITKDQQIQKIKMQRQYKELVQCTFKPQTNKPVKKQMQSQALLSSVRGAKQYMCKINQIKQKKMEQQMYKQKVFNLQKNYRPKSYTKIEEFKLSEVDKYKKREKVRRQMQTKQRKQCTFQPEIHPLRY